jgi:hypothetical protein
MPIVSIVNSLFLGIGTLIRGILMVVAINYNIVKFNFVFCSISIPVIFAVSYRLEQAIALMIAIDRLAAIWKPVWYNKNQNYVKNNLQIINEQFFLENMRHIRYNKWSNFCVDYFCCLLPSRRK